MKISGKGLDHYWKIVKFPVYFMLLWTLFIITFQVVSFQAYLNTLGSPYISWIMVFAFFIFVGWSAVSEHRSSVVQSGWAGSVAGIIVAFAGSLFGIIALNIFPKLLDHSVSLIVKQGVPQDTARASIMMMSYLGLIFGPVMYAFIGWCISALAGLATKKFSGISGRNSKKQK